ncbi:hypothetical protein [Hyphococcus lacteus]|uniref:Uncharacterized protein n=1 Tax=Hyphococcus lacteus TaxID=3143536 RepID=A0ABV3Z700_9PROT
MAYEFYSAQTRQVKTAMVLSSATLLLYTIAGQPVNDFIKIPPGQFEIPSAYLIGLFFGSAIYFTASFFVSAKYDKRMAEIPELHQDILDIVDNLKKCRDVLRSLGQRMIAASEKQNDRIHESAKQVDWKKLKESGSAVDGNTKPLVDNAAELIKSLSDYHAIENINNNYRKQTDEIEQEAKSLFREIDEKISEFRKKTVGMAHFHNHFWEYQLPLFASLLSIPASFVISILKQSG